MVYLRKDVQKLYEDQTCERDADYVDERIIKPQYREKHDSCTLVNGYPYPYQEGFTI